MPSPPRLVEVFHATDYEPHVGQFRFHASDARFKILIAGARFGKSLAASKDVLPELLAGSTRGWLVAPTYSLALPEMRYLAADLNGRLGQQAAFFRDGGRSAGSRLRLAWGAEVLSVSARVPETLLGEELDWMLLCEAAQLKSDVFQRFLRARLTSRGGRLIVPSTPRGFNWLHELYQYGCSEDEDWDSQRFATWDNPLIPVEEIESAKATLAPETFDEQYGGAFTTPAGAVYREFQPELHVVHGLKAPQGAIIYKTIDFGFTSPFCCLWAARDSDERLLILREQYAREVRIDEHAVMIRDVDAEYESEGYLLGPLWADPSVPMERTILHNHGMRATPAPNRVRDGISAVRQALAVRADGTPGMYIDASCRNLLREFELYHWQESSVPGEKVPVKRDDHALDALRYLCAAMVKPVGWHEGAAMW